jgi:hypothetical protein
MLGRVAKKVQRIPGAGIAALILEQTGASCKYRGDARRQPTQNLGAYAAGAHQAHAAERRVHRVVAKRELSQLAADS